MIQSQPARFTETASRTSMPRQMLGLEGATLFLVAAAVYYAAGFTWWVFPLLLLLPDISALGYLAGPRVGSAAYNIGHFTAVPLVLGLLGWWLATPLLMQLALIWLAHIGMDRFFGYGLKYPDNFKHNHLDEV